MRARTVIQTLLPAALLMACGPKDYIAKQLEPYGYLRIAPPRGDLVPGTLITIETNGDQSRVRMICRATDAFPGVVEPQVNATETSKLKATTEKTFSLEAGYLKALTANAKYSAIDDITLTLANPKVFEYATADLYKAYAARTSACKEAVSAEAGKQTVYAVLQAFQADVDYHILSKSSAGANAGLSKEVVSQLATDLGGTLGGTSADNSDLTISGKRIFWGLYPEIIKPAETRGVDISSSPPVIIPSPPLSREERMNLIRVPATVRSAGVATAPQP